MANATYVSTVKLDKTDMTKSISTVDVEGILIHVEWWYSLLNQWSKDELNTFICAEALAQTGAIEDARALMGAPLGSLTKNKSGVEIDTRNWQQRWLDDHPIPQVQKDPILG